MFCVAYDDPRIAIINAQMERLGVSARWIGAKLGISNVSVSKWLAGEKKPRDANAFASILELLREYEQSRNISGDIQIKRVGVREVVVYPSITAGAMSSVQSDTFSVFVMDWGNDHQRWGRTIDGYSMSPELEPGDIVLFEDREAEPYHVVHAYDNGQDTVKVYRKRHGKVELVPINPDYDVIDGTEANIKGVAVVRIRRGPNQEESVTTYPHGMRCRVVD